MNDCLTDVEVNRPFTTTPSNTSLRPLPARTSSKRYICYKSSSTFAPSCSPPPLDIRSRALHDTLSALDIATTRCMKLARRYSILEDRQKEVEEELSDIRAEIQSLQESVTNHALTLYGTPVVEAASQSRSMAFEDTQELLRRRIFQGKLAERALESNRTKLVEAHATLQVAQSQWQALHATSEELYEQIGINHTNRAAARRYQPVGRIISSSQLSAPLKHESACERRNPESEAGESARLDLPSVSPTDAVQHPDIWRCNNRDLVCYHQATLSTSPSNQRTFPLSRCLGPSVLRFRGLAGISSTPSWSVPPLPPINLPQPDAWFRWDFRFEPLCELKDIEAGGRPGNLRGPRTVSRAFGIVAPLFFLAFAYVTLVLIAVSELMAEDEALPPPVVECAIWGCFVYPVLEGWGF